MRLGVTRSTFLGLAIAGVTLPPLNATAQSSEIRMGSNPSESYAEPYYALDAGFFSRAGLNVQVQSFANGAAIAQAIIGGALDVGLTDVISIALARVRNIPLVYFAPGVLYSSAAPTSTLCTTKESSLHVAKDLEGQTIAVNALKSMSECGTREWMRLNGADPSKAHFVEIPPPAIVPAILRGTVAAGIVSEPAHSQSGDSVRAISHPYDSVGKKFFITSYAANRDWLAQNGPLAHRLLQTIVDAGRWANANHATTAQTLAKYAKIDPAQLQRMTRVTLGDSLEPAYIQPVIDVAVRYDIVARAVAANDIIARV